MYCSQRFIRKGKLRSGSEILEMNGRVVAGFKLENVSTEKFFGWCFTLQILHMIEMGKSDTIIISILDSSSPLSRWKISQLLQSQKSSGRTAEYIEQIRCNVYDNTTPVTTRPPRKGVVHWCCQLFFKSNKVILNFLVRTFLFFSFWIRWPTGSERACLERRISEARCGSKPARVGWKPCQWLSLWDAHPASIHRGVPLAAIL